MRLQGKNNQRNDQWYGTLYQAEIDIAKLVFKDTLPYDRIYISNVDSPTGAITVATSPYKENAEYLLLWHKAYAVNIAGDPNLSNTFIHELTHVWQSQYNGYALTYLVEAGWAQLKNGVKDIFKDGYEKGIERIKDMLKKDFVQKWNNHRDTAYHFKTSDFGKNFNEFNPEQQANIIESWFSKEAQIVGGATIPAGRRSPKDARYSYIRDNIHAKSPNASYVGVKNLPGYSAEIADIQAVLFNLGYLKDEKYVDGFWGRITKGAVIEFQKRHNLPPDGEARPQNSLTRKKLFSPFHLLLRSAK